MGNNSKRRAGPPPARLGGLQGPDLRDTTHARNKTAMVMVQLAAIVTLYRLQSYSENPDSVLTLAETNELLRLQKWWQEFGAERQVTLLELAAAACTEVETVSRLIV